MMHSILKFPILSLLFSLNFTIHLKLIFYFFSFDNREKNCKKTAKIIIPPPNNISNGGFSFKKNHAQRGPKTAYVNIIIPTSAEGVDLAPIVINKKTSPT